MRSCRSVRGTSIKSLPGYIRCSRSVFDTGRINQIIREEMNAIGGQKCPFDAAGKGLWQKTNRWDDKVVDIWFKTD